MTRSDGHLLVRSVSHQFALKAVLEQIDLDIVAGRVVALVGPSGCGKTTLLHLCAGLTVLRSGRIENSFTNPVCVFQQTRLLPWKRTSDNIALGLKAAGIPARTRTAKAAELGQRMGLRPEDLEKYPHQLSGGMQSRAALARAFVLEPDLLLLDEPFSALDIGLKLDLYSLLLQHLAMRNMGAMLITHDLMEAVRLSDEILVMAPEPGRIVRRFIISSAAAARDDAFVFRTTAEFLQDEAVRNAFSLKPASAPPAALLSGHTASHVKNVITVGTDEPTRTDKKKTKKGGIRC